MEVTRAAAPQPPRSKLASRILYGLAGSALVTAGATYTLALVEEGEARGNDPTRIPGAGGTLRTLEAYNDALSARNDLRAATDVALVSAAGLGLAALVVDLAGR